MKFKVGDRVRVKDNNRWLNGMYAGKLGDIVKVMKGRGSCSHPYRVVIEGKAPVYFHANELELEWRELPLTDREDTATR